MAIIRGKVFDPQGKPVTEARIYYASAPVSMPDVAQLTDVDGQFTMSASTPGQYVMGVASDDWGEMRVNFEVKGDEPVTIEVHFPDPKGIKT